MNYSTNILNRLNQVKPIYSTAKAGGYYELGV